ncbi:inorganic diphosphatase [Alicyclobacillus shizuokensis]|uniref:inorganic diphosphatase n=1 Tax=Alicyclobacillus shizuokensis TaxID=392014 RepID=UPI00082C18D7|nr:inorganic diphosphatase [Alicyclobacillus shizuokensis]MCL6625648.1 inorganic diphosphatase [Alicyclobacillus shizuokensis]
MANETFQVDVLIEIPRGSQNKYEFDKKAGVFRLDRVLYSPMHYPADYGYIQNTLAEDGDPLDALVLVSNPTFPGCVIETRVVGVLLMADDKGPDEKLIGVATQDPRFAQVQSLEDIPPHILKEIAHFFQVYKDLEGKETHIEGWKGTDDAQRILQEALARYGK